MNKCLGFGAALLIAAALQQQVSLAADEGAAPLPEGPAKLLNERMAHRAELMVAARRLDAEIRKAWLDEANTSPEIAKLRSHYAELQRELAKAQRAIQAKVEELPAVAAKIKERDSAQAQAQALSKLIEETVGK